MSTIQGDQTKYDELCLLCGKDYFVLDRETGKPVRPNGFDALGGVGIMNNSDFLLSMWRESETELRAKFSKARTMHNVSLRGVEYRLEMRGLTIDDFNPISQAENS